MISFIKKSWQKFSGLFLHNFASVILRQYLRHIRQVIKYLRINLRKKRKKFFFLEFPWYHNAIFSFSYPLSPML